MVALGVVGVAGGDRVSLSVDGGLFPALCHLHLLDFCSSVIEVGLHPWVQDALYKSLHGQAVLNPVL